MKLTKLALSIFALVFGASICFAYTKPATNAAIQGDLYYTTFTGPLNIFTIQYTYTVGTSIVYSGNTFLKSLDGADGIIFNPNNGNLLIGEQDHNKVAQLTMGGAPATPFEVMASADPSLSIQAFNLIATPDKSTLLALPNEPGTTGGTSIDTLPLFPLLGNGTSHAVSGPDTTILGLAFIGSTAFYGDATDHNVDGHLGVIDLTTFTTTRLIIVDAVDGTATQGALPSHGVVYDSYTGDLIISSYDEIWQVAISPDGTTATIIAKVATPLSNFGDHWDQISPDGNGHLFGANSNGDIIFIDYSASGLISSPVFQDQQFLATDLDDVVSNGTPGRMTGGGSVFTTGDTRVTHGFELHCDTADVPNNLEINWGSGNRFHLDTVASALCYTDPSIDSGHPKAPFNTYAGYGTGSYDGIPGATANWVFTDAGEPGKNDTATITIVDAGGNVVLTVSGLLKNGNQQAHTDNK